MDEQLILWGLATVQFIVTKRWSVEFMLACQRRTDWKESVIVVHLIAKIDIYVSAYSTNAIYMQLIKCQV